MASISIKANLSIKGINAAIQQLDDYIDRLQWKCEVFVNRLADEGIAIAKQNVFVEEDGVSLNRGNLVYFEKDVASSNIGATCIVVPFSTPYITFWKKSANGQEVLTAEVDPLLMAEFGSGAKAIDGHRGTFPNQKHANEGAWAWYDLGGTKHISTGQVPSRPIYKAKEAIVQKINDIAVEVFSTL